MTMTQNNTCHHSELFSSVPQKLATINVCFLCDAVSEIQKGSPKIYLLKQKQR